MIVTRSSNKRSCVDSRSTAKDFRPQHSRDLTRPLVERRPLVDFLSSVLIISSNNLWKVNIFRCSSGLDEKYLIIWALTKTGSDNCTGGTSSDNNMSEITVIIRNF